MQKSTPSIGARRPKTPILAQKSGVIEYYGYRDYDAASGRWIARDPIAEQGGLNLYGMVGNDAVGGIDYLGQSMTIVASERDVTAGRTWNAYDLTLSKMEGSSKCKLEVHMYLQFFFKRHNGRSWAQSEMIDFVAEWQRIVKEVWSTKNLLKSPLNCKCCKGDIEVEFSFRIKMLGYTISDHWEVVVEKVEPEGISPVSSVVAFRGKVNLDTKDLLNTHATIPQRAVAHEFGHMMGIWDEYNGRAGEEYANDRDSIMHSGERIKPRHYKHLQKWVDANCKQ